MASACYSGSCDDAEAFSSKSSLLIHKPSDPKGWVGRSAGGPTRDPARRTFDEHFAGETSEPSAYFAERLKALHPGHTLVATQSSQFQLFEFAGRAPERVKVLPRPGVDAYIRNRFVPGRGGGEGKLQADVAFAGFDVEWQGEQLIAYHVQWPTERCVARAWYVLEPVGSYTADSLLLETCQAATLLHEEIWVFNTPGYWDKNKAMHESINKTHWDDIILPDKLKTSLKRDVVGFFDREKIYRDLGVPWKRGIIFLGPPGNGKTASLKALIKEINRPCLYVKTFSEYGDEQCGINSIFERARENAPCVLILEDLDSLINDKNRSFFLNEVDGLESNDGILLIGTTNHFERLDGAISNRPSRFDRKYSFPNPSAGERERYLEHWSQTKVGEQHRAALTASLIKSVSEKTEGFSYAYMQEVMVSTFLSVATQEDTRPLTEILDDLIGILRQEMEQNAKIQDEKGPLDADSE